LKYSDWLEIAVNSQSSGPQECS